MNMDFLSNLLAITGVIVLVFMYNQWRSRTKTTKKTKSPPEPEGAWPIIGHMHLLAGGKPIARPLAALADKYGPIYKINLGVHPVVVVSSWEAMKDCFTTNDKALASRPDSSTAKYLSYNLAGFGFAPYGSYWREMRKIAMLELLSARRLEMLKHVRISELSTSIKQLYCISSKKYGSGKVVVISEWIEQLTLNIIARMIAGKTYGEDVEARKFRKVVKEFMFVSGEFLLSDALPYRVVKWVDMLGKLKNIKSIMKELDLIVGSWIEEHVARRREESKEGDEQDFIDVMLSVIDDSYTQDHTRETIIKATILNIILAGSDTTAITLTWIMSALLNNNHALSRAQQEIDTKVGKNRWVEESDIKNLVYLQAIVKETLRLYPPGPIAVPHQATEDCQIGGYDIPKGTRLFPNVWKLHRDPRVWTDPDEFVPERFLTTHAEVDVSGQHFEFTPFGSGRRACPGIGFALQVTHLTTARLLQGFDFATPLNEPVDMTEGLGITLPKATPLEVIVTSRLDSQLYQ
ncbi:hypothetical protein ACSBR1_002009 [Camellia fascicularis]